MLRRASIIDQKVGEFSFCNVSSSRGVRFMQNEHTLVDPTKPPGITVFALVYLPLLT
jgi:hypothetical protein